MPRAKRAKQYRKLMVQFAIGFGFHVPYQVLVDADFLAESMKCKMEIIRRLEDTLHGQVKPRRPSPFAAFDWFVLTRSVAVITQCSMRHLYARKSEPGVQEAIELAKTHLERRRCGHHPDEYPEPLSAHECIHSVVDPKQGGVNKHRYVCAINDDGVRASLRRIPGVPLIFIRRSVVLMEPMATATAKARSAEERRKFRAEIKMPGGKRKREEEEEEEEDDDDDDDDTGNPGDENDKGKKDITGSNGEAAKPEKKKKPRGPKGPNPLSVKKKKKPTRPDHGRSRAERAEEEAAAGEVATAESNNATAEQAKKKRRRKHRGGGADGETAPSMESGTGTLVTNSDT